MLMSYVTRACQVDISRAYEMKVKDKASR